MDKENNSKTIYLDNAATTFPKPESVYTEMDYVNRNLAVNTGRGSYSLARKATEIIDRTREKALKLIKGKDVADIVLTPSATIAMNVIIGGLDWSGADICYVSPFEHNAVMRPLHLISEKYGFDLIELPLKSETLEIDFEKMEYMFSMNPPTKVFATHISNVTGYILPVKEITEMAKKYNLKTFSDLALYPDLFTFGAEYDFYEINDGYADLCAYYNLKFKKNLDMDIGLKYEAMKSGKIDVINIFTTDGQLSHANLTTLKDDKHFFPSYYCATIVREETLKEHPELERILEKMNGILTDQEMADMNYKVDVEHRTEREVAVEFLKKKGLLNPQLSYGK